jgi:hypothetical protein
LGSEASAKTDTQPAGEIVQPSQRQRAVPAGGPDADSRWKEASMQRGMRQVCLIILGLALGSLPGRVLALRRQGPFELTGNVSAQQLFRHSDIDQWAFIQQRNTVKIRFDYNMLDRGKFIERFELPFLERARLFMLYRGVYDSVYDYSPGFEQKDIYGLPIGLDNRLEDLGHGSKLKFENRLREAYVDLRFKHIPLSLRLGRQQIVWGETDNFRLLDRINALDLTWHLQQESWDELRIPYWMIKWLWSIGRLESLREVFLEGYWNPGDWYPNKRVFLPRPWSLPITDPLVLAEAFLGVRGLYRDTRLFGQGDYSRQPGENSQVGARLSAMTPQGIQFTLNYFYQRWSGGDDGTNSAAFRGLIEPDEANDAHLRGELPIEAISPYVHAFGASMNYSDEEHTGAVFRLETVYEWNVPFLNAGKQFSRDPNAGYANPAVPFLLGQDVFGITKRDMWKGMVAFDRPTWIRFLNRRSTFLILGQFFWHYLRDNIEPGCNDPNEGLPCPMSGQGRGLRGALSQSLLANSTMIATRNTARPPDDQIDLSRARAFFDRVRTWEILTTLAATTFYKGGSIVPLLVYVLDPVNKYNMEVLWSVDYYVTNDLIVNLGQRYFINTTRDPVFETWGIAGANRGRSETQLRLTYQF